MSDVPAAAPAASAPTGSASTAAPASPSKSPATGAPAPTGSSVSGAKPTSATAAPANSKFADGTGAPAAGEPTATEPPKPERRKYKLKVDGAEVEEELTDDEISVRLQKGRAADKRMQEAAEYRKQYEKFVESVKKDPVAALKDPRFGIDVRKQIEDQLIAEWESQQKLSGLSPQEREAVQRAETAERERDELRAEKQREQETIQQRQRAELETKVQGDLEREFMDALDKSGLPKNRQTLAIMAEIAALNLDHGIELTRDQLVSETNSRLQGMHKQVMGGLQGEALVKYLGDDVVREIVRYSVSKVRGQPQSAKTFEPPATSNVQQVFSDEPAKDKTKRDQANTPNIRKFFRG